MDCDQRRRQHGWQRKFDNHHPVQRRRRKYHDGAQRTLHQRQAQHAEPAKVSVRVVHAGTT
jgi:hypothetical protein